MRKDKFEVKSFTEIASKIIPKNFFTKYIPDLPNIRCMRPVVIKTTYTTTIFAHKASKIFKAEYSALSERSVVKEPAPASNGNTSGT